MITQLLGHDWFKKWAKFGEAYGIYVSSGLNVLKHW